MTASKVVGSGTHTYEMDEEWQKLPEGWEMPAAAVAVDSSGRVFCYNRSPEHPIVVFDRDGSYLYSWGQIPFAFPHAISIDKDENVWLVDRDIGQVMKFTPQGELLMSIGTRGYRSDTGVDPSNFKSDAYKGVVRPGGPFNLPAGVAIAPSGEVFVSDGYANCRVHRFSPAGGHIRSWGEPGGGPGQFHLPHGIWIDARGQVLVADRENDRVQAFSQDGRFLSTWPAEMIGPAVFYVDNEDVVYVAEHNGGMISVLTPDGERLARWGSLAHQFCHGITGDSHGDIYVVQKGDWGRIRRVVKFIRKS